VEDLDGKITGDTLPAVEWNQLPAEVQNIITQLGQSLSSGDLNQLGKSIAGYVANGTFYTDSGIADAYVLTKIGTKQTAPSITNGFELNFIAGNSNTGASTVTPAGLGVKNIKLAGGGNPVANDISGRVELSFDLANDWFELLNPKITGEELVFDTVADMVNSTLTTSTSKCRTLGRNAKGDGGAASYDSVVTGVTPDVDLPDTFSIIVGVEDATISFVIRIINNTVLAPQVGCFPVGTAVNDSLQALFNLANTVTTTGGLWIGLPGGAADYGVDGTVDLRIQDNTRLIWTGGSYLKLLSTSFGGGVIGTLKNSVNVEIYNPLIDANNIFTGGSGENGLGLVSKGVTVFGGHIKNCARGNVSPWDGGKGLQSEGGNIIAKVYGTLLENCHIGTSARRDSVTDPVAGIDVAWDGCTYRGCNHAWFAGMNNINSLIASEMSVRSTNFSIENCGVADAITGFDEGAILLDRATNVFATGTISGPTTLEGIIRGRHRNCTFDIKVDQNADGLINIDPSQVGLDTNLSEGNRYNIMAGGTYGYLLLSDLTDATHPNRFMNNSIIDVLMKADVSTAIVSPAARNGNCRIKAQLNGKIGNYLAAKYNSDFTNMAAIDASSANDYETDTAWLVDFEGSSGSIGATAYTERTGSWTKIGNMVFLSGFINISDLGSWGGNVRLGNVPFNSGGSGFEAQGTVEMRGISFIEEYATIEIGRAANNKMEIRIIEGGVTSRALLVSELAAGSVLSFSIAYRIA